MTLLVFGKTGQVASELRRQADLLALGRDQADLADPAACAAAIRQHRPSAVINAAAYTAVDRAEEEEALAHRINADAPGAMAATCADLDLPFLHISTDYVFDGSGDAPHVPSDPIAPINAYGRSKAAGEAAIRDSGARHAILRTSWVFSAHGTNFVKTMLRLGETRARIHVVDDQIGGPTPASAIAATLIAMARAMEGGQGGGTYHFAGAPAVSWKSFAETIFARSGQAVTVEGVPTACYPAAAARPLNSRLDCALLETDFGITPPDWAGALDSVIKEIRT